MAFGFYLTSVDISIESPRKPRQKIIKERKNLEVISKAFLCLEGVTEDDRQISKKCTKHRINRSSAQGDFFILL